MNKKLLKKMQEERKNRLETLRSQVANGEIRAADLDTVQDEIDAIIEDLQNINDELSNDEEPSDDDEEPVEEEKSSEDEGEARDDDNTDDERGASLNPEQRDAIMGAISEGLNIRARRTNKQIEKQIRSAFANFVVGNITEAEARALGIDVGNGSVTVPDVVASEVITYAQEENLLRKYGTVVRTKGNVKYPVLVKKAMANVKKKERGDADEIDETVIEFDQILLSPAEFDALATVTKKLLKMSGVNVEDIVIEELKKAYVRKETNYMFNGDDASNENPGALAKKAVAFTPSVAVDLKAADAGQKLYNALIELKNTPCSEVMKKGMFIINRAALTAIEQMKTNDGLPLLRPFQQAEGGIGHTLVGYPIDWTDAADKPGDANLPRLYFGDFKAFKIQEVIGALEIQKLVEKYANKNRVGFQIYNLIDGQLVYSPFEPAVFKMDVPEVTGA
ncbi:phage major capsid protein [Listeria monocytogenes]|uniref:phage major capsid protein n=1 Tax=Listeria monocytogenes TaxID=1639 RepID=UPI0010D510A4|nr:phage major capsid protein [Listeria monocytogenes]EAC7998120.1 phage major capsid protein [Listeria monocytogenes]EIL9239383.1 phage major capsid protein [Listeria monocytogenes]EJC6459506.1 phage major capsid protein [Listeria monocytogenes]TYU88468.1 phage major capsid protein [Listeria monocytogenes]